MDPKIIELENKISVEQDAAARTKLETELAALNTKYNALVQDEQVKLAKSQTLERYIEKGKTWVDSLQNQAATQMVLINKLADGHQAAGGALRCADQVAEDRAAAGRGAPDQRDRRQDRPGGPGRHGRRSARPPTTRMADMLEAHEDHMVFARKVLEQKAKADERFARRFAEDRREARQEPLWGLGGDRNADRRRQGRTDT